MTDDLLTRVRAWIDDDPDPLTRAELEALIAADDVVELQQRFSAVLGFGTAGIRGVIGAGPNRMNRCIVARTTAGLCAHLSATLPDAASRGICIAFDGRRLSREFAEEAAEVALGAGFVVHCFDTFAPTPVLAHSVLHFNAAAGIMITASHNPRAYNGYKAYGPHGTQLITPDDDAVESCAADIKSVRAIARVELSAGDREGLLHRVDADAAHHYFNDLSAEIAALAVRGRDIRIAYTALHGVGEPFALRALDLAGLTDVHSAPEQSQPDATFPTVAFPNPEEPSAMERVVALGIAVDADLVLANDPDADRLAVAARTPDGDLRGLSGNQIGLLLTQFLLERQAHPERTCVLSSIVTTPLVARVARAFGAHWEATLTGTKWICSRALELERSRGLRCVIGFEEAIGYCIGSSVRDKDGLSAAAVVGLMAADAKRQGRTLHHALERLQRHHGIAASRQRALTIGDTKKMSALGVDLQRLAASPPTHIGSLSVHAIIDLSRGETLPPTPGVIIEFADEQRICIRPSGTEPKLKCYLDARVEIAEGEVYASAQLCSERVLDELSDALDSLLTTFVD